MIFPVAGPLPRVRAATTLRVASVQRRPVTVLPHPRLGEGRGKTAGEHLRVAGISPLKNARLRLPGRATKTRIRMVTGHRTTGCALVFFATLSVFCGCESKQSEKKPEVEKADSGARHVSGVDKNLAEAVQAVAGGAGPQAPGGGPPATGVFPPGAADHEIRPGEPPKLSLGGKGSGPTIQFASGQPKKKLEGQIEISVQTGPRSAMPTVDLLVSSDAPPAKTDNAAAGPLQLGVRVTASRLAKEQPGQLPPGLDAQMGKARGSKFSIEIAPNGSGRVVSYEVSKEFDPELAQIIRSGSDALALALLPYPTEPVGEGAFWMVTSREGFAGLDVVAYRMMKLEKIDKSTAVVSVNTKRYVAGGTLGFSGLPPNPLQEFSGATQGTIAVPLTATQSISGQLTDSLVGNLGNQVGPNGQ